MLLLNNKNIIKTNMGFPNFSFCPQRLAYKKGSAESDRPEDQCIMREAPRELYETEDRIIPGEEREKEKKREGAAERRQLMQEFALGEHDVLPKDRIRTDYVSQITGSVDVTPFSNDEQSPEFYRNEVNGPNELLLGLFEANRDAFTPNALRFIEDNKDVLMAIRDEKPLNHKDFTQKITRRFPEKRVRGAEGALNLLLAFNRVVSKLQPGILEGMRNSEGPQLLKINLVARGKRSVEVALYSPEIKDPDLGLLRFDIGLKGGTGTIDGISTKYQKPDGTYVVLIHPFYAPIARKEHWILVIDPRTRKVTISHHGYKRKVLTFDEFNAMAKGDPWFLHGASLGLEKGNL